MVQYQIHLNHIFSHMFYVHLFSTIFLAKSCSIPAPQRTGLAPQVTMRNSPPAWRRTSSPRWCRWASCLRSKWSPRQTWDLVWSYLEVISKFFVCCERLHSIFMIFILLRANIIWYSNLFAVRVIIPWRRFLAVIRYFFHWFVISKAKLDIVEVFKTSTGKVPLNPIKSHWKSHEIYMKSPLYPMVSPVYHHFSLAPSSPPDPNPGDCPGGRKDPLWKVRSLPSDDLRRFPGCSDKFMKHILFIHILLWYLYIYIYVLTIYISIEFQWIS